MSFPRYPKYKDSGVEWIGEVPQHWKVHPVKEHFRIVGGSTPSSSIEEYWDGDIPWATPSDLSALDGMYISETARMITDAGLASCATTIVPPGSIVLSTRAPIGAVAIAGKPLCTNQGCKSLVPDTATHSPFFTRYLSVSGSQLNLYGRGTTFLELSADALAGFPLPVPPRDEQREITAFLDRETAKIDALVAEQERLIELLKEKRQAVISHAVTKGLNPDAPMKDSGVEWLGEVPAHWEIARIGTGFREVTDPGVESLPILSVSIHHGVSDDELGEEELDRKVSRSEDRSKYKRVAPGDLVYNMMRAWQGAFGTVLVEGMVSPAYVVSRPTRELSTQYLEHLLRTPSAVEQMRRYSRGITDFRLRLYWDEFKDLRIPFPPPQEAAAICAQISALDKGFADLTSECMQSIELLAEHRSALISAAVTGQIDVRRVQRTSTSEG